MADWAGFARNVDTLAETDELERQNDTRRRPESPERHLGPDDWPRCPELLTMFLQMLEFKVDLISEGPVPCAVVQCSVWIPFVAQTTH